MQIIQLKEVDSTHKYLKEYLKNNVYSKPLCILRFKQNKGIGSRGNEWLGKEGNLFFSFVLEKELLPSDLPMQSASIYFSFLLKRTLKEMGSKLWLKWPNDFYLENKKIGGTITNLSNNLFLCGIGLNLIEVNKDYGKLDIVIDKIHLLNNYFDILEKRISWKEIFSEYKIEYSLSLEYETNIDNKKVSLKKSILNPDGSISINEQKVFGLR